MAAKSVNSGELSQRPQAIKAYQQTRAHEGAGVEPCPDEIVLADITPLPERLGTQVVQGKWIRKGLWRPLPAGGGTKPRQQATFQSTQVVFRSRAALIQMS